MKESQRIKWENQLKQGKKHHILVRGVLGWGMPVAILYILLMTPWGDPTFTMNGVFFGRVLLTLILFALGGVWFGSWTWKSMKIKIEQNRR